MTWEYGHGSTVRMLRDAPSVIRELLSIRRRVGRVQPPSLAASKLEFLAHVTSGP